MFYAYIIESEAFPGRRYTGFSANIKQRLIDHNRGVNSSTKHGRPWKLIFSAAFLVEADARAFETYLKTSSGKAFAAKRLLPR